VLHLLVPGSPFARCRERQGRLCWEVVHFVKAGLDTVALAYQPVPRMPVQADCAELRLAVRRDGIIRFELPAFQD